MTQGLGGSIGLAAQRGRLGISAAFAAQGFTFAVVLTHLGAFEDAWDLSDLAITVVMFAVAVLAAVGSAGAAGVAAQRSSAMSLRIGLLLLAVGVTTVAIAPNLAVFSVGLCAYGLGLGSVDASTNMQAVACEALQGRSILTSFHAMWSAGGILGALETSWTASAEWSLGASLSIAVVIPLAAACAPLLGNDLPDGSHVTPDSHREPAEQPQPRATAAAIPWMAMAVLGLAIVLFYMADSATQSWSTIYLGRVLDASDSLAPIGYALYQGTSLVSRIAGDHVVRRWGAVAVVRCAATIGALGLLLAVIAQSPWLAIAGFGILGIGIAVVAPLSFAAAGRLAMQDSQGRPVPDPAVRRATADAIVAKVNQANYVGFVLGGVLTGVVGSASSMREGFLVPLVGIALILPVAKAFDTRRRGTVSQKSSDTGSGAQNGAMDTP